MQSTTPSLFILPATTVQQSTDRLNTHHCTSDTLSSSSSSTTTISGTTSSTSNRKTIQSLIILSSPPTSLTSPTSSSVAGTSSTAATTPFELIATNTFIPLTTTNLNSLNELNQSISKLNNKAILSNNNCKTGNTVVTKKQVPIKPKLKPSAPVSRLVKIRPNVPLEKHLTPTITPQLQPRQLKISPKLSDSINSIDNKTIENKSNLNKSTVLVNKINQDLKKKPTVASRQTNKNRSVTKKAANPTTTTDTNSAIQPDDSNTTKSTSTKSTKKTYKRFKRDHLESAASSLALSLDPEITNLIKSISSNSKNNSKTDFTKTETVAYFSPSRNLNNRSRLNYNTRTISPKTDYSQSLFDSIDYLSNSWTNIFKTGNDTDQDTLNLFRQFHCADCLKSFQQQQQQLADTSNNNKLNANSSGTKNSNQKSKKLNPNNKNTSPNNNNNNTNRLSRIQMNTPPPPLQPIADDTLNGLYHYFGQPSNQPLPSPQLTNLRLIHNSNLVKVLPNSTTTASTNKIMNLSLLSTATSTTTNTSTLIQTTTSNISSNNELAINSPMSFSPQIHLLNNDSNDFNFDQKSTDLDDDDDDDENDAENSSQINIQQTRQSLSRKLAQRRSKQELIDRGIYPASRVSMLHYSRMKHLEKAQLQDILKTKIEKRPNRELLVQKNILPDSRAAPSLQLKCNELKRARLANDLNEKLAKRPGPLELVESGILVTSDSTVTEAIKGGKINYPRTSSALSKQTGSYHHQQQQNNTLTAPDSNEPAQFSLEDSSLGYLNFNLNNLTDEDSNTSQTSTSTTKTSNTIGSVSSSTTSFNFLNGTAVSGPISNNLMQQTTNQTSPPLPTSSSQTLNINNNNNNTDLVNFNDLFQSSNVPSPTSSTSTNMAKSSPSSSPYHTINYDFLSLNNNTKQVINKQQQQTTGASSGKQKSSKSSFSSASSTTSSTSSSSKTNKPSRNNSNTSVQSNSSSNGSNGGGGGSGSTKKLSQLIFHEYRGPNLKSSKTSISLKSNNKNSNFSNPNSGNSNTLNSNSSNNNLNSFTSSNSNLIVNNTNGLGNAGNGQTNTNEIYFDDSNDSMNNNLNSAIMDFRTEKDELNPHKIRMKQQKIFLKLNNIANNIHQNSLSNKNGETTETSNNETTIDATNNHNGENNIKSSNNNMIVHGDSMDLVNATHIGQTISSLSHQQQSQAAFNQLNVSSSQNNIIDSKSVQVKQLQQQQLTNQLNDTTLLTNNQITNGKNSIGSSNSISQSAITQLHQIQTTNNQMTSTVGQPQSIQLVPIGDIQMLDNLRSILNNGTRFIPIRTISVAPMSSNCSNSNNNTALPIENSSTSTLDANTEFMDTNGKDSSSNGTNLTLGTNLNGNGNANSLMQSTAAIKIINASPLVTNRNSVGSATTANLFSLDGNTITPLLIATTRPSGSVLSAMSTKGSSLNTNQGTTIAQAIQSINLQQTNANQSQPSPLIKSASSNSEIIFPYQTTQTITNSSSVALSSQQQNLNSLKLIQANQQTENGNEENLTKTQLENQPSITTQQETNNSKQQSTNIPTTKTLNIEDMSLNELKEECRRRKLFVKGNKQTLIERLKNQINQQSQPKQLQQQIQQHIQQQLQSGVKSPDSGVNMDSSPSLMSNDQSPCSSVNSLLNQINHGTNNVVTSSTSSSLNQNFNSNKTKQISGKQPSTNQDSNQQIKATSSLDEFFSMLDVENLGSKLDGQSNSQTNNQSNKVNAIVTSKSDNNQFINDLTNRENKPSEQQTQSNQVNNQNNLINSNQIEQISNESVNGGTNDQVNEQNNSENLSETAAYLEKSLKNSAELLKQLSSVGQLEHLHKLEKQMKESMQLIEKLKSASNKQPMNIYQMPNSPNSLNLNKLRTINSMPSNLRELESQILNHQSQLYANNNSIHTAPNSFNLNLNDSTNSFATNEAVSKSVDDSQYLIKINIPLVKNNYEINEFDYQTQLNNSKIEIPNSNNQNTNTPNNHSYNNDQNHHQQQQNDPIKMKDENVYQFDTLMKELSTSMDNNSVEQRVTFSCNTLSQDEEDNSNETDNSNLIKQVNSKLVQSKQLSTFTINGNSFQPNSLFSHDHHSSSLPSIDSLIDQSVQQNLNESSKSSTDRFNIKIPNLVYGDEKLNNLQTNGQVENEQQQQSNTNTNNNNEQNQNVDMDWNESEFLQFCQELDETENLATSTTTPSTNHERDDIKSTIDKTTTNDLMNHESSIKSDLSYLKAVNGVNGEINYLFENTHLNNQTTYLITNNLKDLKQQNTLIINKLSNNSNFDNYLINQSANITFTNDNTSILNFDLGNVNNDQNQETQQTDQHQLITETGLSNLLTNNVAYLNGDKINMIDPLIVGRANTLFIENNNSNTPTTSTNSNIIIPWEFDNDLSQIASYLQSPTV